MVCFTFLFNTRCYLRPRARLYGACDEQRSAQVLRAGRPGRRTRSPRGARERRHRRGSQPRGRASRCRADFVMKTGGRGSAPQCGAVRWSCRDFDSARLHIDRRNFAVSLGRTPFGTLKVSRCAHTSPTASTTSLPVSPRCALSPSQQLPTQQQPCWMSTFPTARTSTRRETPTSIKPPPDWETPGISHSSPYRPPSRMT